MPVPSLRAPLVVSRLLARRRRSTVAPVRTADSTSWAGRVVTCAVAVGLLATPLVVPRGEPTLPQPASPKTIAALVAASTKIKQLPNNLTPNLGQAINDTTGAYYPSTLQGCPTVLSCVFGDRASKTTIVLFGDSHAYMWLPSLVKFATKSKLRLVLVWMIACPAAGITVWNQQAKNVYTSCNTFRSHSIAAIRSLRPALVLLSSRTTEVDGANQEPISQATWQRGLESTIKGIETKATKVAVVGDIMQLSVSIPPSQCLNAQPNNVQACSVPNPNNRIPGHYAAEQRAAHATNVPYLNPLRWLCTTSCSPVIGNLVVYYNNDHVSATYAAFLGAVFSGDVASILAR